MIIIKQKGNFRNTERLLSRAQKLRLQTILEHYGTRGVAALASATPRDTGKTASSWGYQVSITNKGYSIAWTNSNEINGILPAILIQYGHGTGTGGYVEGLDYINPAMKPIFNEIADAIWKEVSNL
jgi:hypothetical protein